MRIVSPNALRSDILFGRVYGIHQIWDLRNAWNFIGDPRPKHGFMHVLCDHIVVTYKDGKTVTFPKGELLYIPKGCEYSIVFEHADGMRYKGLAADTVINFEMRTLMGEEVYFSKEIVSLASPMPQRIADLFNEIVRTCVNLKNPHLRVMKLFYDLLEKISVHLAHPDILTQSESSVSPAVLYLDNHISDTVSIPQLAQMCLLSVSAFRKAFKEYTGYSPVQYRMYSKIVKAQQMLRNTEEMTVKEIAEELGFYDSTYFYRVFFKFTGKTPSEYRSEHSK